MYSKDCVEYRAKFNKTVHTYLKKRLSKPEFFAGTDLYELSKEKNLIAPHDAALNVLSNPFDIISVSGLKNDASFFLMDHISNNYVEGVGKTSIMLKLFGIEIPYGEIPDTAEEVLQSNMKRLTVENKETKLISSDMFFIGINDGSLAFCPMKCEQVASQWDLARHIFRVKDLHYTPGKQRKPASRAYLEVLGERCYLDSNAFADLKRHYSLDSLFFIERKHGNKNIIFEEKSPQKRLKEIERTLKKNPCYHQSPFWAIEKEEHMKRVMNIMKGLDVKKVPNVYKIFIPAFTAKQKEPEIIEKTAEKILQIL